MGQYANQPDFATKAQGAQTTDTISPNVSYNGSALYVGTGGDIRVILTGVTRPDGSPPTISDSVIFKNVQSGSFLPVIVDYIMATSTTANDLIAIK